MIFIVYLYKIRHMKNKFPFEVKYTKEMSTKFNKELKESGKCAVNNPKFYGEWNMVEFGTPEYDKAFDKK